MFHENGPQFWWTDFQPRQADECQGPSVNGSMYTARRGSASAVVGVNWEEACRTSEPAPRHPLACTGAPGYRVGAEQGGKQRARTVEMTEANVHTDQVDLDGYDKHTARNRKTPLSVQSLQCRRYPGLMPPSPSGLRDPIESHGSSRKCPVLQCDSILREPARTGSCVQRHRVCLVTEV